MGYVLVVTSERLGVAPAGPGLRALGLATGLAAAGIDTRIAAPEGSTGDAGVTLAPLRDLSELTHRASVVIVPASLVNRFPEVLRARRLCIDFAGPYPLEAAVSGASTTVVGAAETSAAMAISSADLVLCSQPRQIPYARALVDRRCPDTAVPNDRFLIVPFGIPTHARTPRTRPATLPLQMVWPGGLWDWLDPKLVVAAMEHGADDVTTEFWGAQNPDPSAPRMRMVDELRTLVEGSSVRERITFVDWIPSTEFDARLCNADLAVTFDDGGIEAEHAFRTRLLHALWLGVPTIATRGEYMADLAAEHHAGWTIPPNDSHALAELLTRLAHNRHEIEQAGTQARTLADRFDYATLAAPLADWVRDETAYRMPQRPQPSLTSRLRRMLRKNA